MDLKTNLNITKSWYAANNRLVDYHKLYRCASCKYKLACLCINDNLRINCADYKFSYDPNHSESNRHWQEMSYVKMSVASNRTMSQRLMDGE